ncbi:acyl-coenzyme A thioesterase 1-like [Thalassophryne amazonica]|uniref:acyl-coenzyme A thioesterase 1-like n=1 Tax=Thalassophryne amazonica TaxID=390379 RepID=UPI0014726699|nr:acyl-coenzyme A thioesterase 1-like [Thalassophryne amazonica]
MDRKSCCVRLSVQPSRVLVDEKLSILVQNLCPDSRVTLHALYQCEGGHNWEAFAHYVSDATGSINVVEEPSLGGTYLGVEPMGLLWSLRPVPGSLPELRLRKMNVQTPMVFKISVYQSHQSEGFMDQTPLASVVVERWYMAPGVRRIPVTEERLTATLFLPPGPGPFPGLLDLWGGAGQLMELRAALLASHGFASMALDYLTCKITKETGKAVDNQYFETALKVLQRHPQVMESRIAMLGLSFGAAMTLKMAVYSEAVKLRCAVVISGSHVQPVEGSVAELYDYFAKNSKNTRTDMENKVIFHDLLLPIPLDPSLKVDMGRLPCPLLVVVGEDDQNWPSLESAEDMMEMVQRAGKRHLLTILSYPNAGHLIEPPYSPHFRSSVFKAAGTSGKIVVLWGGETVTHCRAQEDAWSKILVFLYWNLYSDSDTNPVTFPSHL